MGQRGLFLSRAVAKSWAGRWWSHIFWPILLAVTVSHCPRKPFLPSSHPLFCQSRHRRDEACPYSFYINSHKNKYTKYRLHQKSMSDVRRRDGGEESRSIAEGKNHTRLCCSSTVGQVWKINIDGFGLLQIKFLCYKFKGRVCLEKDPA